MGRRGGGRATERVNQNFPELSDQEDDDHFQNGGHYPPVVMSSEVIPIPESFQKAVHCPWAKMWRVAMKNEFNLLKSKGVWTKVNPHETPTVPNIVNAQWDFSIARPKPFEPEFQEFHAKLVIDGGQQKQGIDFTETHSPTASYTALRMMLSIAATRDYHLHHAYIERALLNTDMDTAVYVRAPQGAPKNHRGAVFKLHKAMEGLRQGHRLWHQMLDNTLKRMQFQPCQQEPCLYVYNKVCEKAKKNVHCMILVYVDHLVFASSNAAFLADVKASLGQLFQVKHLGLPTKVLGMRVSYNKEYKSVHLDCVEKIDEIANILTITTEEAKYPTPIEFYPALQPSLASIEDYSSIPTELYDYYNARIRKGIPVSESVYRSVLGKLQFIARTCRPDIAYAVHRLSSFGATPNASFSHGLRRLAGYLIGTKSATLILGGHDGYHTLVPNIVVNVGCEPLVVKQNQPRFETKYVLGRVTHLGLGGPTVDWDVQLNKAQSQNYTYSFLSHFIDCHSHAQSMMALRAEMKIDVHSQLMLSGDCDVVCEKNVESAPKTIKSACKHILDAKAKNSVVFLTSDSNALRAGVVTKAMHQAAWFKLMYNIGVEPGKITFNERTQSYHIDIEEWP